MNKIRLDRLKDRVEDLERRMSQTDSDMFEYYATLEIDKIQEIIKRYEVNT